MTVIAERINEWRSHLLDLTKRNQLVSCKYGSRGAVELRHPAPEHLWKHLVISGKKLEFPWKKDLVPPGEDEEENHNPKPEEALASPKLDNSHLLATMDDKPLDRRLRRLQLNARTSLSEQGVNNLFLAFGMLSWSESLDGSDTVDSPLVLVPVQLTQESAHKPWTLQLYEEEVVPNHSLRQYLLQRLNFELPEFNEAEILDNAECLQVYLDAVQKSVSDRNGWTISNATLLGTFSFQKLAMWMDLDTNADQISGHKLCCAIAGDGNVSVNPEFNLPSLDEFDTEIDPSSIHSILDCDSSQLQAIVAAREGQSFVLDGPPGTGKSQTIANIVAEFLANGKTVLFVSEKSAALEVVKRRLDDNGLGDFCLDCHSHKASKKDIIQELGRCLDLPAEKYKDQGGRLKELRNARAKLNAYADAVNRVIAPLNLSPYQVHGLVAELEVVPRAKATIPNIMKHDAAWLQEIVELLKRLTVCEKYIDSPNNHPWRKCRITRFSLTTLDDTRDLFEDACSSVDELITAYAAIREFGFDADDSTVSNIQSTCQHVRSALDYPVILLEWLENDPLSVANNIVGMCESRRESLVLRNEAAEFKPDVEIPKPLVFAFDETNATVNRLLRHREAESIRSELNELGTVADAFSSSTRALQSLQETIRDVSACLSVSLDKSTPLALIPKLQGLADDVSQTTLLRPGWFEIETQEKLLQVAEEYEELFLADAERHLDFTDNAHEVVTVEAAEAVRTDAQLARIVDILDVQTVRSLHQQLQQNLEYLSRLNTLVVQVREFANELILAFLGDASQASISRSQLKLGTVLTLTESALSLSSHHAFQRSWLLQETRDKLLPSAQAAAAELEHVEKLRAELSGKFAPRAFEENGQQFAKSGVAVENFWCWFGTAWRKFREQAQDYFIEDISWWPPRTLKPARRLRAYHRRMSHVIEYENTVRAITPLPQRRKDAWDEFAKSLEGCERVSTILGLTTAPAGPDHAVDLDMVRACARSLQNSQEELQQFLLDSRHKEALRSIECDLSRLGAYSLDELQHHISSTDKSCSERLAWVESIAECLAVNRDVELAELTTRAELLQRRRKNELRRKELEEGHQRDLPAEGGVVDWGRLAHSIRIVQQMQQRIPKLPPNLIKAMCLPDGINRIAVGELAETLGAKLTELTRSMDAVNAHCMLHYRSEQHGFLGQTSESLGTLLNDAATAISRRVEVAHETVALLLDGCDLRVDQVPAKLEQAIRLREADAFVRSSLTSLPGLPDEASIDWESTDHKARWLKKFCNSHDDGIPEHLKRLLHDENARSDLAGKVEVLERQVSTFRETVHSSLATIFDLDDDVSTGIVISKSQLSTLATWLNDRVNDIERLEEWTTFQSIKSTMAARQAGNFLDQVFRKEISAAAAPDAFRLRFYRTWLDEVYSSDPALGEFSIEDHESLIDRFRDLDRKSIQGSHKRIRSLLLNNPSRPTSAMGATTSETGILNREANKKRRHLSLRQLFNSIPSVLQSLKPCMMMSPLAVSTYLESQNIRFDLVIFDEASQVLPHDAIGAIYRGRQLIVAGDQKQLPPTTFFSRMGSGDDFVDDDEEGDEGIGRMDDYESILDVCTSLLPRKRLCWHYRSRREPLIAFSNHHYYDEDLVTFPSVYDGVGTPAVEHVYVADGKWIGGRSGGVNEEEAKRVVDLVCEHYKHNPKASLGVITLNQRQQLLVIDLLAEARGKSNAIDQLLAKAENNAEPLFVKNLENVQGDERDHIIISMAYGYDENGKFSQNFGPINKKGGERRLNVAVTRARTGVKFVSSVKHFDVKQSTSRGSQTLRAYLEYAETGELAGSHATAESLRTEMDSTFEHEIQGALERHGFHITPRIGCGQFRIDFGLRHPEEDRFLLGLECDGETYSSTPVARDRERLRPQVLEQLGWHICRVWSTDWVRNPERQINRIQTAFESALNGIDQKRPRSEFLFEPEDEEFEEPTIIRSAQRIKPPFGPVETVSKSEGSKYLVTLLDQMGATEEDDLIRFVAKEMGTRAGKNVRRCINAWIQAAIQTDKLSRDDDNRLSVASNARPKPPRPDVVNERFGSHADAPADDLTAIKGIGPRICQVLHAAGVRTFADLSRTTPDQLTEILLTVDKSFRGADTTTWPKQARRMQGESERSMFNQHSVNRRDARPSTVDDIELVIDDEVSDDWTGL